MTVTEEAGHGAEAEEAGDTARTVESTERARAPERWSVQRESELVLRLLRGEALDAVSRESQVPAHELESWKRLPRAGDAGAQDPVYRSRFLGHARGLSR